MYVLRTMNSLRMSFCSVPDSFWGDTPCSSRRHDVHGHDWQHGTVHGHGDGHLVERNAVEQDLHVLDANRSPRRLSRRRRRRAGDRNRSRDGSPDRRPPIDPSGPPPGSFGRTHWTLQRLRNRRTDGPSRADPRTSSPWGRAQRAGSRAATPGDPGRRDPPRCTTA